MQSALLARSCFFIFLVRLRVHKELRVVLKSLTRRDQKCDHFCEMIVKMIFWFSGNPDNIVSFVREMTDRQGRFGTRRQVTADRTGRLPASLRITVENLQQGCMCCSFRAPFRAQLSARRELWQYSFWRLETWAPCLRTNCGYLPAARCHA